MIIIASSPRSGSTFLRFILCHIFYPEVKHDFDTVNALIPTLENGSEVIANIGTPIFCKTHEKRAFASVHLVRHVGDKLVSEYYYQKKFFNIEISIEDWITENDFGKLWRDMVNYYYGCYLIKYEDLIENPVGIIDRLIIQMGLTDERDILNRQNYARCISQCSKDKIRQLEITASLPNEHIPFVRDGSASQWQKLPEEIRTQMPEQNKKELTLLGY